MHAGITLEFLNGLFKGKRIVITTSGRGVRTEERTGVCRSICYGTVLHSVEIELTNGDCFQFIPERIYSADTVNGRSEVKGYLRNIQLDSSILRAHESWLAHQKAMEQDMLDIANALMLLAPEWCKVFLHAPNWYTNWEHPVPWQFPAHVKKMVEDTIAGTCTISMFFKQNLASYGATNMNHLEEMLLDLGRVWDGKVRIEIEKLPEVIVVNWYATEFEKK